jgi:GntR family transcriptional regulator
LKDQWTIVLFGQTTQPYGVSGSLRQSGATMDQRLPLHARLRDTLASHIAQQKWPVDSRIPLETQVATHYGVAPNTVRRALEQLVSEELLERRQGSGTFVRRPAFRASLFRFFRLQDQEGGGEVISKSRIVARTVTRLPAVGATALRMPGDHAAIRLDRVRLWAGSPVVMEKVFLPLPRFAALRDKPLREFDTLLYLREFGLVVGETEDELRVGLADARRAELLSMPEGDAVAIIDRLSLTIDGMPLEWRRAWGRVIVSPTV